MTDGLCWQKLVLFFWLPVKCINKWIMGSIFSLFCEGGRGKGASVREALSGGLSSGGVLCPGGLMSYTHLQQRENCFFVLILEVLLIITWNCIIFNHNFDSWMYGGDGPCSVTCIHMRWNGYFMPYGKAFVVNHTCQMWWKFVINFRLIQ